MDLLQTILNAKDGRAVDDLGRHVGLDRDQTMSAIQGLMPALAAAMAGECREARRPSSGGGGLMDMLGPLLGGSGGGLGGVLGGLFRR